MPLSSDTKRPDRKRDEGSELTPLVTDEARGFLEGRISAEAYSEFVRRHAAREAGRDTSSYLLRQAARVAESHNIARLAAVVIASYAIVGAVLSSNKESGWSLVAALGAGVIGGATVMVVYESWLRRK
jgi:hypothetical protein